jgi:hypothetical protein
MMKAETSTLSHRWPSPQDLADGDSDSHCDSVNQRLQWGFVRSNVENLMRTIADARALALPELRSVLIRSGNSVLWELSRSLSWVNQLFLRYCEKKKQEMEAKIAEKKLLALEVSRMEGEGGGVVEDCGAGPATV